MTAVRTAASGPAGRLVAVDGGARGEDLPQDRLDRPVVEHLELARLELEARPCLGVGRDAGGPGVRTPITGRSRRCIAGGSRVEMTTLASGRPIESTATTRQKRSSLTPAGYGVPDALRSRGRLTYTSMPRRRRWRTCASSASNS